MKRTDIQIIIMCKAPVPGKVKTRLMSRYTADEAAALHSAMATTVIERAMRLFANVVIAADDPAHPFFGGFGTPVVNQGVGNLGARMQGQVNRILSDSVLGDSSSGEGSLDGSAESVLLLGTDSPHMPNSRLMAAADALKHTDIVLGPVDDGGYDLVGMSRLLSVFEGVAWSSEHVLSQTLANIHAQQLSVRQLEISFDVDFPADIKRARQAGWVFEQS